MTTIHEATSLREFTEGVTFRAFRQLATRRGWSVEGILALLARHGAIEFGGPSSSPFYESPRRYLTRVLDHRRPQGTDDLVIPYRCIIALYVDALVHDGPQGVRQRACACGCGQAVMGRHRYASAACRKRISRQGRAGDGTDMPDRPPAGHVQQGFFCDIRGGRVDFPSCHTSSAQIGSTAVTADRRAHAGEALSSPGAEG